MASIYPQPKMQFFTNNGDPAVGYKLYTYEPGTAFSVLKTTYSDDAGTPNTNPIVMDARGEASVFWDGEYDVKLTTDVDVLIWTQTGVGVTGLNLDGALVTDDGVQIPIEDALAIRPIEYPSIEAIRLSTTSHDYIKASSFYASGTSEGPTLRRNGTTGTPTGPGASVAAAALAAGTFRNASGIGYSLIWPQTLYFESFGAIADGNGAGGGTDNALFLQAAATYCDNKSIRGSGTYLTSKQINFTSVHIICDGQIFIDGSGITGAPDAPNAAVVRFAGTGLTQISDLSSDVVAGTVVLNFATAHGRAAGDYICIYNPTNGSFNSRRTYYRAGEWCKVAEIVSSTSLKVSSPLFASYTAAAVDVYVMGAVRAVITGKFKVLAPDIPLALSAFAMRYAVESDISNVEAICIGGTASLDLWQCVNITGQNVTGMDRLSSGAGVDYGLSIANCQHLNIQGYFTAYRHGCTMGGGDAIGVVPNRDCNVSGMIGTHGVMQDIMAADFHGNAEHCSYSGVIMGGVNVSGDFNRVRGKVFATTDGVVAYAGEMLGFNFDFQGVEFICRSATTLATTGCFDVGGNSSPLQAATTRGGTFDFQGSRWIVPGPTAQQLVWIRNRGAVGTDLQVNFNNAKFIETNPVALTALVRIDAVSGDPIDRATFEGVSVDRNQPFTLIGVTQVVNWADSGTATVAVTTAVNTANVAVTFARQFPVAPKVTTGMTVISSGGAGDRCMARVTSVTTTGFTMQVYTADEANFTANANITIDWMAK